MWKVVSGSVTGTSHQRTGKPCQDYCAGRTISTLSESVLVAVCADGAGSAEKSEIGAKIACETFLSEASKALRESEFNDSTLNREVLLAWNQKSIEMIQQESDARNLPIRELACTLLTAIVGENWAFFTQVGDGAIIFDLDDGFAFAFWPESSEYVNATRFLTDSNFHEHFRCDKVDRTLFDVALLTDGLQMLALNLKEARVHEPFFRPMFQTLQKSESDELLHTSLLAFLDSKRVNDRTDDDKTLFLATRRVCSNHVEDDITSQAD